MNGWTCSKVFYLFFWTWMVLVLALEALKYNCVWLSKPRHLLLVLNASSVSMTSLWPCRCRLFCCFIWQGSPSPAHGSTLPSVVPIKPSSGFAVILCGPTTHYRIRRKRRLYRIPAKKQPERGGDYFHTTPVRTFKRSNHRNEIRVTRCYF